jgi:hypothetical protein
MRKGIAQWSAGDLHDLSQGGRRERHQGGNEHPAQDVLYGFHRVFLELLAGALSRHYPCLLGGSGDGFQAKAFS